VGDMTKRERVEELIAFMIMFVIGACALGVLCHLIVTEETEKMHKKQNEQMQVMRYQAANIERGLR
jgi:hypothetical protein